MAIEFEQETGVGSSTSTSYASLAQFRQYWENRGKDYMSTADNTIKAWLNSATEYIDNNYNFKSQRTSETQALEWPRWGANDCEGYYYDNDEIPQKLIDATCYMAAQAKGELDPVSSGARSLTYGPVSKTFGGGVSKAYKVTDKLLRCIIVHGSGLLRVN